MDLFKEQDILNRYLNPFWKFTAFIVPCKPFVRQNHDPIVRFPAQNTAQALCRVTHCVKREEVVFPDLELVPKHKTDVNLNNVMNLAF